MPNATLSTQPNAATPEKGLQQNLESLLAEQLAATRNAFKRVMPPESALLTDALNHALTSQGKFLRPMLTLLCGMASHPEHHCDPKLIETAAVAEMIHVATLAHDDVLDEADLRRGKPTIRNQWGNTVAILSGDYLLAQSSRKLADVGNIRLVAIFSDVLSALCDGEVEQIRTSYTLESPWESYLKKTICKTASLFAASCEAAGVVNQLPEEHIQALRQYGECFGIAFQIRDDLLDFTATEAELGKPVLEDLKNGILNAPVRLALSQTQLTEAEKATLQEAIQTVFTASQNEVPCEAALATIQNLLQKANAIEETKALIQSYLHQAQTALTFLPDSVYKNGLLQLTKKS